MYKIKLSPYHLVYLENGYKPINKSMRIIEKKTNNKLYDRAYLPVDPEDANKNRFSVVYFNNNAQLATF